MEPWPQSWAGASADLPFGQSLVDEMRPFIAYLETLQLSRRTVRKHLDHLWVIGGEIIRALYDDPRQRQQEPRAVLLRAIALGAPLVYRASEEEQRGFDATAHKLLRFLTAK
jgi:hypothetical protein